MPETQTQKVYGCDETDHINRGRKNGPSEHITAATTTIRGVVDIGRVNRVIRMWIIVTNNCENRANEYEKQE